MVGASHGCHTVKFDSYSKTIRVFKKGICLFFGYLMIELYHCSLFSPVLKHLQSFVSNSFLLSAFYSHLDPYRKIGFLHSSNSLTTSSQKGDFHLSVTSIFTRLTPEELEEFCRSHADLSL